MAGWDRRMQLGFLGISPAVPSGFLSFLSFFQFFFVFFFSPPLGFELLRLAFSSLLEVAAGQNLFKLTA